MPKEKKEPKKILRACDACHHRRVRCNHVSPCDSCIRLDISCTWIKASMGKHTSGRRIDLLRKGLNPAVGEGDIESLSHQHYTPPSSSVEPPQTSVDLELDHAPPSTGLMNPPPISYNHSNNKNSWCSSYPSYSVSDRQRGSLPSPPNSTASATARASRSSSQPQLPLHHPSDSHGPRQPSETGIRMSFNPSENFSSVIGNSFSELSPNMAAGFRLPHFGTSLADSYFHQQSHHGSKRNALHDMSYFGRASHLNDPHGIYPNGCHHQPQTFLDVLSHSSLDNGSTPGGSGAHSDYNCPENQPQPHPLSDSVLIPAIALFFERLQSIMPVFTRAWMFNKLDRDEHRTDVHFGSMLIALSAFTLIQPVGASDPASMSLRKRRVRRLLHEAVAMRNSTFLGQNPSLEATMTSFFLFGTLFGLGEENAAWFRLREAVTLGHLLELHEPAAYESLDKDEQERRLRAYWLLVITERAYAIQSGHSISFRGNPRASSASIRRKFCVSQLEDFPNLQSRLFDAVDEKFVDCWNKKCPGQGCEYLDFKRAISLYDAILCEEDDTEPSKPPVAASAVSASAASVSYSSSISPSLSFSRASDNGASPRSDPLLKADTASNTNFNYPHVSSTDWDKAKVQKADFHVSRQWLLNRLWLTCLSHGFLVTDSRYPCLRLDYAIDIARETLRVCNSLSLRTMEAHGIGLTRKLNDIAQTLAIVCREFPAIAMSIPYEGDPINISPDQYGPYPSPSPTNEPFQPSYVSSSSAAAGESPPQTGGHKPVTVARAVESNGVSSMLSPSFAIEAILHKYLDLFKRFRGGDHPYLTELVKALKELPKMAELSFDRFLKDMGL